MNEVEVTFLDIPEPFTPKAYSLGYDPYNSVHALDTFCKVKWGYEGVRLEQRKGKRPGPIVEYPGRPMYMAGGELHLRKLYAE